jgi:putative two-component system response regulator
VFPDADRDQPADPLREPAVQRPRVRSGRRPIVLVVDDHSAGRELIAACIGHLGVELRAADGIDEALEVTRSARPDLIVANVDLSGATGIALCRTLKSNPSRALTPIVLIDALQRRASRLKALAAGADEYLAKPFDPEELAAVCAALLERRELSSRLDSTESVAATLLRIADLRDPFAVGHAQRVGALARALGAAAGLSRHLDLEHLFWGGLLHDIGKSTVPDVLLSKPGALTAREWEVVRDHSLRGERICRPLRSIASCVEIVKHHHERWDGTGYPDGLAGERIPLGARVVAIVDAWDAMTNDRPYRAGLAKPEATRRLHAGAGVQWDPSLVNAFLASRASGAVRRPTSLS